jgi:hypothetical protein
MKKGTPLQPIIEALEAAKNSVGSKDVILGLDFALTMVIGFEPVIKQQMETAKLVGANEALKDANKNFSIKE